MSDMRQLLIDCEVYGNYFLLGCQDFKTEERFSFEICEKLDQRQELQEFLKEFNGFWITFNGTHYDNVVLAHGQINNWWPNESWETVCRKLKLFSDKIISATEDDRNDNLKEKWYPWKFTNIDLYLYWSKLLRLSKKISLKSIGIQLGYPVVQELPFDPSKILTQSDIEELKHYNLEHDLGILRLLTEAFEGKSKTPLGPLGTIQLRQQVVNNYGINAWSMDGPKIASEVLLKDYCNIVRKDVNEVRRLRFDKPDIYFKKLFKDLNIKFQLPELVNLYDEWCYATNTFNKTFVTGTKKHPLQISCGVGGIHSVNSNEVYISTDTHSVITDDISAFYPTNIENYKAFRFPEVLNVYKSFKTKRITETKPGMKAHKKGSPEWNNFFQQDLFYKLILNG